MNEEVSKEDTLLITILEQNWLHARHVEKRRLWFTNIYVLILGGFLGAFIRGRATINKHLQLPLLAFLLILSIFGILFSIRCKQVFDSHTNKINEMMESFDDDKYERFMSVRGDEKTIKFLWFEGKYPEYLGVNWLFVYFYFIMTGLVIFLIINCPIIK